jgi:DNA-binding protein HU-beta
MDIAEFRVYNVRNTHQGWLMTKAELIAKIAEKAKLTKAQAESALAAFQCTVTTELVNDGKVALVGFGTFSALKKVARTGRNPQTGKPLKIAAKRVGKFTAGKVLKDLDACKASCKTKPAAKPATPKTPAKAIKK